VQFSCEMHQDAQTRAFMARTSTECRERIAAVTAPIYTEQDGATILCASGVLLQIADRHFLVSAGHTFDARRMLYLPLWVTSGVIGSKLLPLGQVRIRSSDTKVPYDRTDEPFDIAVCELSGETGEQIAVNKKFLRLADVDPWDRQEPRSWYMVFGYPSVLSPQDEVTKSIDAKAVALATFIYCDERGPLDSYDKEVGIALDFDAATMKDDDGNPAIAPHPGGMSGCGIWRLAEAGTEIGFWKLDDVKLVAIEHTLKTSQKVLAGTRIGYALQMIYRNHADLRPVMEMHFGPRAKNL
jgi:hypothetical protein